MTQRYAILYAMPLCTFILMVYKERSKRKAQGGPRYQQSVASVSHIHLCLINKFLAMPSTSSIYSQGRPTESIVWKQGERRACSPRLTIALQQADQYSVNAPSSHSGGASRTCGRLHRRLCRTRPPCADRSQREEDYGARRGGTNLALPDSSSHPRQG